MKRRSQHILRMLSFAMALLMVLSMLPAGARAEETAAEHEHVYKAGVCTVEGCTESKLDEGWLVPEFSELEEGDYTMVLIPDTQHLVNSHVDGYYDLMRWIADNKAERNIVAAMGMGDMIQRNSDAAYIEAEYKICVEGTQYLTAAGIPWMPMMGNHDYERIDYFRKAFPYEEYGSNRSWFGGSYYKDNLDHTYWFVTAGEREYMILSLGYAPSQAVLDWAAGIVKANPDKSVIVNAHDMVNYNGSFLDTGKKIWNTLGVYHNVVMCACGHIDMADLVTRTDTNGAGNTVYSILADAQGQDQVTDTNTDYVAMLAVLTFDKDGNTVNVNWYSTHYDAFYGAKNQFEIEVPHVCATHTYSEPVTVEPTCTESGGMKYTCTKCGYTYYENVVPAAGHKYGEAVTTKPTCTESGYDTYTCTVCDSSYTDNVTAAVGHTVTNWGEATAATCTEPSVKTGLCDTCRETVTEEVSAALGHSYGDPVYTERIGSKPSYTTSTCTREGCGYIYVEYGEVTMSAVSYAAPAGAQDGAIWDGKIFQTAAGKCYVYDLQKQATVKTFELDGIDAIVAHGNTACFGSTYYAEGDKYPLLYVGVWKQYETQPDMTGTCCVYRIIENADGSFSSELVQVIKIGFAQDKELWASSDDRPFGTFVVDTDENKLYVTVGRVNHSRFFCFDIPAVTEGTYNESYGCNVVTLTKDDSRDPFDTAYINYPQGASYHGGQIYIQESYGSTRKLTVVDLKAQAVVYTHDMVKEGLSGASYLLAFDPDTADLYYGTPDYTGAKKLYKLTFYGEKDQIPEMVYESLGTIPGAQDGAIWNGKLFQPVSGKLHVYDMKTKTTVQTLTLENFGSLTVHGNSVCFGSTANLKEGEYPLLYVGLWTRIASVDGSCCVYRITEENGTFSTDLVQVIKIGFGNDTELWKSGYSRPYATYAADGENNKLYAMVTRDTEPCTRVFEFEIPDATEGTYNENGYYELTLTKDNILDWFDTAPVYMPQGACYYHGKIYMQESSTPGIPSMLKVIDLESRKISYSYVMADADDALLAKQATMICVDPADGEMYYGVQDGSTCYLYRITEGHTYTVVVTTERTCTTDGVTTYTCTCGYTYTEVIPAIGHSYVNGKCEVCGEGEPEIYQESYGNTSPRQDGAIWNGKLFQPNKETCNVYDLKTKTTKSFTLDGTDAIVAHGNTACFGSTYYAEGDEYPLLYVSVWTQYQNAADRQEGTCCVYRITETDGVFSGELVQVIEIGFTEDMNLWKSLENNGDSRPYGAFVVDTDANVLYAMVMRDAEKQNRVFAFDIPAVTEGTYNESYGCNVVTLEQTNIKDQFDTEYVNFQQGACYYNGKIYTQESFVQNKVPPVLKVIDLNTETVTHSYDMTAAGISGQATLVCVDPADGAMYYGTDDGKLYKLTPHAEGHMYTFDAITVHTCTQEGKIIYTCACGDTYTEIIPANGHTYESVFTEPVGSKPGYTTNTCTVCGHCEVMYGEVKMTFEELGTAEKIAQDGAIWDGKLFETEKGKCRVYDLATLETLAIFDLDGTDVIKAHGNTACFGSDYYEEGDKYPLLYVTVWKPFDDNPYVRNGACLVYRLTEVNGEFGSELVQVIEVGFIEDQDLWKSGSDLCPWGNFVVDTDNDVLYAMVQRDDKVNRVFSFELPAVGDGVYNESYGCNVETLEKTAILNQFETKFINTPQGISYHDGQLYIQESTNTRDRALNVIDLEAKDIVYSIDMVEAGIDGTCALLSFDPDHDGDLYYGVTSGKLYKLNFNHEHKYEESCKTEPTCTEDGSVTYTCACGHSYTEVLPANGHNYEDHVCTVCGKVYVAAQNMRTGTGYICASAALAEAETGDTVQVLLDHADTNLIVPAGVTLNLNGCVVEATNVLSFGVVMDDNAEVGGIRIPIDTAQAFTKLQRGNGGYLPVYDTTDGMYKFFEYTLVNAGHKREETCVAFGFKIQFTNMDAYSVLAATENSGISLTINLQWTGMTVPYVPHRITDSTITEYGEAVATTRSISKAMVIRVYGLDNLPVGGYVKAAPVLDTIAEVGAANDPEEFVKAQ